MGESTQTVPTETQDGILKVAEVNQLSNNEMRVIVEGTDLDRLTSPEAKKLAFEQRLNHGMANAGVEPISGTYITDEETQAAKDEGRSVERWRREFRLVGML